MENDVYHLHKWSVTAISNAYLAPEVDRKRLQGFRDDDDRMVITGPIVEVQGRIVKTTSGSTYILEDIDPDYLKWMEENGYVYNPESPIKLKEVP